MKDYFEIIINGYRLSESKPDFIILEYYENERNGESKEAFLYNLNYEFSETKPKILNRIDKNGFAFYNWKYKIDMDMMKGIETHFQYIIKRWSHNSVNETSNPLKPAALEWVNRHESKIPDKIKNWRQGTTGSKIECAAYCEYIYEEGYFEKKEDRIKTCKEFAFERYGLNIGPSLGGGEKAKNRKTHYGILKRILGKV
jgi:hypothetical protein